MVKCTERHKLIRNIVIAGFVCSVIFHYINGAYLGKGYPYSTFLFVPHDRFNDFFNIFRATEELNPFSASVSVYFPFTYIPVYILTLLKPAVAYALYIAVFLSALLVAEYCAISENSRSDRFLTMFALTAMSYPILFILDRGNLECMVFIFIGLFVYLYKTGRVTAAVLFLSCAVAMKIYPAVFCVLLISNRRWKQVLLMTISALVLTIGSALLLKGGISGSWSGMQNNLLLFKRAYLDTLYGLQHNSSLYVPTALIAAKFSFFDRFSKFYPYAAVLLFLVSAAYTAFRETVYWKKIAILSCMMILLPQVSYDYKLVHIFLPLLLFVSSEERSRFGVVYPVIFGLLLIPKDYFFLVADVSINGTLNALLMLACIGFIMADRRKESPA